MPVALGERKLRKHNDGLNIVLVDFETFLLGQNIPPDEKIVEFSVIVEQARNLKIAFQQIFLLLVSLAVRLKI